MRAIRHPNTGSSFRFRLVFFLIGLLTALALRHPAPEAGPLSKLHPAEVPPSAQSAK